MARAVVRGEAPPSTGRRASSGSRIACTKRTPPARAGGADLACSSRQTSSGTVGAGGGGSGHASGPGVEAAAGAVGAVGVGVGPQLAHEGLRIVALGLCLARSKNTWPGRV